MIPSGRGDFSLPWGGATQQCPQGPVGRLLRDLLLPLVFRFLVTDRSQAWIYDHHLDWDTPITPTPQTVRSSPAMSDASERAEPTPPGRRGAG